jgi:hypothetical protein
MITTSPKSLGAFTIVRVAYSSSMYLSLTGGVSSSVTRTTAGPLLVGQVSFHVGETRTVIVTASRPPIFRAAGSEASRPGWVVRKPLQSSSELPALKFWLGLQSGV